MSSDSNSNNHHNNIFCSNDNIHYKNAIFVIELLESKGFISKLAGGCVRDRLLGVDPYDYDVATTALPNEVISVLNEKDIKVVPTGIDHGTVTAVFKESSVEITTLRKDVLPLGRRAIVELGGVSFKEDAIRRDFTINAMYEDSSGNILDYFGGRKDLENKRLAFVGKATDRIKEDYLRILRFFRFWTKLKFRVEDSDLEAISSLKEGLNQVSNERIVVEIKKIFSFDSIKEQVLSMIETGVMSTIFKELRFDSNILDLDHLENIDEIKTSIDFKVSRFLLRFSYILKRNLETGILDTKGILEFLKRLKLSNLEIDILTTLSSYEMRLKELKELESSNSSLMEYIDSIEKGFPSKTNFLEDIYPALEFNLENKDLEAILLKIKEVEKKYHDIRVKDICIDGNAIKKEFKASGKLVGEILNFLKIEFRNLRWSSYTEGINLVKNKFFN